MEIRHATIIGMGALGAMYGAILSETLGKDGVRFVADERRVGRYQAEGITCNGKPCHFTYILDTEKNDPADLLIFAVKWNSLPEAMETAKNQVGENTIILSVMNGISSEEVIAARFGRERVLYSVAPGMDAVKLGSRLTYTQCGTLSIGIPKTEPEKQERLDAVVRFLDKTHLKFVVEEDIMRRMWSKFMLNVGVNQVLMVEEGNYGTVQHDGPAKDLMVAAMKEVQLLAGKQGYTLTDGDIAGYVRMLTTLDPEGMPSMRQDGLLHRPTEVEMFAGTVIRLAGECGVEVPVNQLLYKRVKEMEEAYL